MQFTFNEEQIALKHSAGKFLKAHAAPEKLLLQSPDDSALLWKQIAQELGWTALIIPERFGGLGLSQVELSALMEEMGSQLCSAPFFSTVCLYSNTILLGANEEQKNEILPKISNGNCRGSLAYLEKGQFWNHEEIETTATPDGSSYRLQGAKTLVLDGVNADSFIVAARTPETRGVAGISLFLVQADSKGLHRESLPTLDITRPMARVSLDSVLISEDSRIGAEGKGGIILDRALSLAGISLSAEQVGGAQRCLDMAVDYSMERHQFGRPIGSFQAIKHKCADMLLRVESARSAAYYAAWSAKAAPDELSEASLVAQSYCSEAFFHCAAENIQIHGGIGFTWEHPAHLYFKRARSSASLLSTPSHQRNALATLVGM